MQDDKKSRDNKKSRDDKKSQDDFWDLSSLLPKKRPPVMRQPNTDTEPVTIEVETQGEPSGSASLSLRFREVKPTDRTQKPEPTREKAVAPARLRPTVENVLEYSPDHGLIKNVKIQRWHTKYSFYEQFRFDAVRCKSIEGKPCPHVPFFSYTPQYRQMSQSQLEYYFYWRSECKRGNFLEADFAYVLLYIYEIINVYTPSVDSNEPSTDEKFFALDMLTSLWLNYRDKYKALDKYLSEWLPDFCLIHRLPPPAERLSPIIPAIMATTSFLEFFISDTPLSPKSLIAFSSNYDWQKSKYISDGSDELKSEFRTHIEGALRCVSESGDKRFNSDSLRTVRGSRDAFCGSLCAHSIKRRIDIEYISYSRSLELRSLVTAIVKYSENKLRAHFGIKSRLKVEGLDGKTKSAIDDYFASVYPADRRYFSKSDEKLREERYYEEMYGALSVGIDEAEARRLEDMSWSVTERLAAEEFGADETVADVPTIAEAEIHPVAVETESEAVLSPLHLKVLEKIYTSNPDAATAICHESGKYPDEIVSEINEYAVDLIGDVIIESVGGSYITVEDYAEEIYGILHSS